MHHCYRNNYGVSLIELLVALTIISLVVTAILGLFSSNLRIQNRDLQQNKMRLIAQKELEKIIASDYRNRELEAYGSPGSNTRFIEKPPYLMKVRIENISPKTVTTPKRYPFRPSQDTLLKKITLSIANINDREGKQQIDLVYFKSP